MNRSTHNSHFLGTMIVTGLVVLLLILHQDNWFWTDGTLVMGFLPIGLLWHACLSVAAALTWLLATKIAWPFDDAVGTDPSARGDSQEGRTR